MFDYIVVTAASARQAAAYEAELRDRALRGDLPAATRAMAVADPGGKRIGSGGATFNAVLAVASELSARRGDADFRVDALAQLRVLVVHSGGDSQRSPTQSVCGKAWSGLPTAGERLVAPVDHLIEQLAAVARDAPPGVLVACSDVLLTLPEPHAFAGAWSQPGVTGLAIRADAAYGPRHGVYAPGHSPGSVRAYFQKASLADLRAASAVTGDGQVLLDSGVVFFDGPTAVALARAHTRPPLRASTGLGVSAGDTALRTELFSDVLLAAQGGMGRGRGPYLADGGVADGSALCAAREALWEALHATALHMAAPRGAEFAHVGTTEELRHLLLNSAVHGDAVVGPGSVVEHSVLGGEWHVGSHAWVSGVRRRHAETQGAAETWRVHEGCAVQELAPRSAVDEVAGAGSSPNPSAYTLVVFGVEDGVKLTVRDPAATYCGTPWSQWLASAGATEAELWGRVPGEDAIPADSRTLWTARLFPVLLPRGPGPGPEAALWLQRPAEASPRTVAAWRACRRLSLRDLLARADVPAELRHRAAQRAAMAVARLKAAATATVPPVRGLASDLAEAARGPVRASCALSALRHASLGAAAGAAWAPLARALALTAQLLAGVAGGIAPRPPATGSSGGRSVGWCGLRDSLAAAEGGHGAVAIVENAWARILSALACPHEARLAAAGVEELAFAVVSRAVAPPMEPVTGRIAHGAGPLPVGAVVRVRCPARIDLAGGWSDTPPITYTNPCGGCVVNVAVNVNGEAPIRVVVERIPEARLLMVQHDASGAEVGRAEAACADDLADHTRPEAVGALGKCAFLALGLASKGAHGDEGGFMAAFGEGGVKLTSQSSLPHGSGLGTSSIMAAGMVAALARAAGVPLSEEALLGRVLAVEQLLTTGGGWQDQAGAVGPGFKATRCAPQLPLALHVRHLWPSAAFRELVSRHLVLVYTGQTRLAKNLLVSVLRRWFRQDTAVAETVDALVQTAEGAEAAVEREDLAALGAHLTAYWGQKRAVAEGAEPEEVSRLIEAIRPHALGWSLAGAGGGGFLVVLLRDAETGKMAVAQAISGLAQVDEGLSDAQVFEAEVSEQGMEVEVEGATGE